MYFLRKYHSCMFFQNLSNNLTWLGENWHSCLKHSANFMGFAFWASKKSKKIGGAGTTGTTAFRKYVKRRTWSWTSRSGWITLDLTYVTIWFLCGRIMNGGISMKCNMLVGDAINFFRCFLGKDWWWQGGTLCPPSGKRVKWTNICCLPEFTSLWKSPRYRYLRWELCDYDMWISKSKCFHFTLWWAG